MSELKTEYWDNGNKKSEQYYKDGKLHGNCTHWYEDGQKSYEGNWKDGNEDGKWTEWSDNGQGCLSLYSSFLRNT